MKDRPIIMSTESVKAILDGRKTQTRRVIKFQPEPNHIEEFKETWTRLCRYGQVGDRLWVRETHIFEIDENPSPNAHYNAEQELYLVPHYKSDGEDISEWTDFDTGDMGGKWRPSIFMPRWASRITLEITGVREERVQEITEEDAIAEGCIVKAAICEGNLVNEPTYRDSFAMLWDSLNAKRGYGWAKNPFVWVIEFKGVEKWH